MAAGIYDIYIERGSDFELILTYKDSNGVSINLSGCSVDAELKETADLSSAVLLQFTATITNASGGEITLSLTKAQTSSLVYAVGPNYKYKKEYAYDVLLNLTTGKTVRILNGKANVSPGVTS